MNKSTKLGLLMIAAAVSVDLPSMASDIDVSTGNNPNWTYDTTQWLPAGGGSGVASIVTPNDADWYGGWVANDASSSWIAGDPNNTRFNNGTYSLAFDLTGYDLSSVSLAGSWTIDDAGSLYLNGNLLGSLTDGDWSSLFAFSAPSSDFVAGVNTLSIVGGATDNFLEGVRLQGDVSGSLAVPEPSSFVVDAAVLLPLGLQGFRLLRKRLQTA